MQTKRSIRRKSSAVTIDEVARLAGVSPMTVSRVINGHGSVRDSTRARVQRAIQQLDYTPNLAASSLATAQGTRIALIYSNPSTAYLSELLIGALRAAARTATQLVVDTWADHDAVAEQAAARALARTVSGVLLPPPLCESMPVVNELAAAEVPVVAIGWGAEGLELPRVRIDDFEAALQIVRHVIAFGHTRIACILGDPNQVASRRRFEGFEAALKQAGLAPDPELVRQGHFTYRSGLEAAESLLALPQPPTAIVAANDDMAAAVVSVAHRRGLDVPRDLSVVGFDDSSAATTVWPELTTVRQPIAAMADAALEMLLHQLRQRGSEPRLADDMVLAHELIVRGSVAAPIR